MSREEAIELLRNCDKLIRYHPNVRKAIELLESEPPAGEFTKKAKAKLRSWQAHGTGYDEVVNTYLEACGIIDKLENALLDLKDTATGGEIDVIEQALKGE